MFNLISNPSITLSNIAIILARGGSKRIPNKNIIDFCGKPLVAWTIEAALKSNKFARVLLSTDSKQIADIGKTYGADVPFLRLSASDDLTPTSEATCFALSQAESYWNCEFTHVTQLMANCPLRNEFDIMRSLDYYFDNNITSQVSCFKFGWMNPWWAFKINQDYTAGRLHPEAWSSRSQDLPDLYCPSGAIWISGRHHLMDKKTFHSIDTKYFELDWISSVDIDDYGDLEMAKSCYYARIGRS